MRLLVLAVTALVLSGCARASAPAGTSQQGATVRLEPTGELQLNAGDYVDASGFTFRIGFPDDATDLSAPDSVTWSIGFRNYCRNRDRWVQSVVEGPSGQVWRGYRVFVPAGPDHPQHWSSGGNGADRYGGPATPGLLEAVARGGVFILAVEDDEGRRWNAVAIDTLSPAGRNRLFAARTPSATREPELLKVRSSPPAPATPAQACP